MVFNKNNMEYNFKIRPTKRRSHHTVDLRGTTTVNVPLVTIMVQVIVVLSMFITSNLCASLFQCVCFLLCDLKDNNSVMSLITYIS